MYSLFLISIRGFRSLIYQFRRWRYVHSKGRSRHELGAPWNKTKDLRNVRGSWRASTFRSLSKFRWLAGSKSQKWQTRSSQHTDSLARLEREWHIAKHSWQVGCIMNDEVFNRNQCIIFGTRWPICWDAVRLDNFWRFLGQIKAKNGVRKSKSRMRWGTLTIQLYVRRNWLAISKMSILIIIRNFSTDVLEIQF